MSRSKSFRNRIVLDRRAFMAGLTGAGAGVAAGFVARGAQAARALELDVVQPWEFKSVIPGETGFAFNRAGVTECLTVAETDGTIVPYLARQWSASEDARIWRFEMREGVTFHDGTPLDAHGVVASLRRLAPRSQFLRTAGIASIEADGSAVVIRTFRPFAPLPAFLCDNTVPILARASFNEKDEVVRIVATGSFKIESMDLPRSIKLARNDAYWGRKAIAAAVNYRAVPHGETRSNIAIAGDADVVFNISNPSVARVSGAGRTRVDRVVIPRVHILMPNAAMPQFADARVRRALSAAIDRGAIATAIMRNSALAATHYLPPILKRWLQPDLAPLTFDIALANRLLDEAGWVRGGDGIRTKDGKRFAGTVRTFVNRPELPVIATTLQAQFRAVGFDLSIRIGEWTEIVEAQKNGSLELALSSRNTVTVPDPIATIAADFTTDQPPSGAAGHTNWKNQPIRDAVTAYTQTTDEQHLIPLRRRIVSILQTELPVIPIVWYDQIVAVRTDIAGFVNDPFEQRYFLDSIQRTS